MGRAIAAGQGCCSRAGLLQQGRTTATGQGYCNKAGLLQQGRANATGQQGRANTTGRRYLCSSLHCLDNSAFAGVDKNIVVVGRCSNNFMAVGGPGGAQVLFVPGCGCSNA